MVHWSMVIFLKEVLKEVQKEQGRTFLYANKFFNVILVRPQQSGNIGGVARSISNHGLTNLTLVDPPHIDVEQARWMAPHLWEILLIKWSTVQMCSKQ